MDELERKLDNLRDYFQKKLDEKDKQINLIKNQLEEIKNYINFDDDDSASSYSASSDEDVLCIKSKKIPCEVNDTVRIIGYEFRSFIENNYLMLKDWENTLQIDELLYDEKGRLVISRQTAINLVISYVKFNNLRLGNKFKVDEKLFPFFSNDSIIRFSDLAVKLEKNFSPI